MSFLIVFLKDLMHRDFGLCLFVDLLIYCIHDFSAISDKYLTLFGGII